jgi:phenylacetate-CoA oxygenase PaaI subunit
MGQDEIGHARLLYGLLGNTDSAAINALVYERPVALFQTAPIASVYSQDWATLLVKHLLYELADAERMEMVSDSGVPAIAAIAGRVRHEETFHLDFWTTWLEQTMKLPEGAERVQAALDELWPGAGALFEFHGGLASDDAVQAAAGRWRGAIEALCSRHGLELRDGPVVADGRDRILGEMRSVYSLAPGAW